MSDAAKDDDYDAAFNDLASLPDDPDRLKGFGAKEEPAPAAEGDEPVVEGDEPVVEGEEPAPAAEGGEPAPAAEGDEPVVDEKAAAKPAAKKDAPVEDDDESLLNRLSDLVAKRTTKEPEKKPEAKQEEPEAEPQIYTPEEQEILDAYQKDWPDIARAEQLARRAEYRNVVGYVFEQIGAELRPIIEAVQIMAERTHLNDLTTAVPEYGDVRDQVIEWVGTQPKYLQDAYNHVIEEGTVEEVADLINRFREANPSAKAAAQPAKKEPELPTTTKQAAQSLAPVSSKRSVLPVGSDPNDFDAAFERFADKM